MYDEDRIEFLRKMREYKERYSFTLYAYTLMPNHFHWLIETAETNLSSIMQGFLQSYTQWYNRKYRMVGHLFQGRYKAILCDKHAYLLILVRYLHTNCVRSGLAKDPAKYQWSSHRTYLGIDKSDLVNTEFVLSQFSRDRKKALQIYNEFITESMTEKDLERMKDFTSGQFMGDKDFVLDVQEKMLRDMSVAKGTVPMKHVDEIAKAVSELTGVKAEILSSRRRGSRFVEARSLFIHLCTKYTSLKRKDIARFLERDAGSLVKIEKRIEADKLEKYIKKLGW